MCVRYEPALGSTPTTTHVIKMAILDTVHIPEEDIIEVVKQSMTTNESVQLHKDVLDSVVNTLLYTTFENYNDLYIEAQVAVDDHTDEDGNLYLPKGYIEPKPLPKDW